MLRTLLRFSDPQAGTRAWTIAITTVFLLGTPLAYMHSFILMTVAYLRWLFAFNLASFLSAPANALRDSSLCVEARCRRLLTSSVFMTLGSPWRVGGGLGAWVESEYTSRTVTTRNPLAKSKLNSRSGNQTFRAWRLTTGCRRRWAAWEAMGRRVGRSPTAPEPERWADRGVVMWLSLPQGFFER